MSKRLKAGVIGCGAIAQAMHLPGYAKCRGVSLEAACDPAAARRREVEKAFVGIRTYSDHRKMLKAESLDVVSVASPNRYHAAHACAALEAGAQVLLEKPVALSLQEADQIAKAVRTSGRQLLVGFSHRFMRGNQRARKALQKGMIGAPYMIRVRFAHTGPYPGWAKSKWFYNPELAGGGALLDMGIHAIDLAMWLMGPVRSVQARSMTLRKKIKVDDNAVMLLEFARRRAMGYLDVGWTSPSGFNGWEICGDQGSMLCDYAGALTVHRGARDPSGRVRGKGAKVLDARPLTGGWDTEIAECVKAFATGGLHDLGIEAGRRSLAVALAAYQSSRTGKRMTVRL